MLTCPRCNVGLVSAAEQRSARFICNRCEGQALTIASLGAQLDARVSYALLQCADDPALARVTPCPSCLRRATRVPGRSANDPTQTNARASPSCRTRLAKSLRC